MVFVNCALKSTCAQERFPTDYPVTIVIKQSNGVHAESIRENALEGRSKFNCNTAHSRVISRYSGWSNNLYTTTFNKLLPAPIFQGPQTETL